MNTTHNAKTKRLVAALGAAAAVVAPALLFAGAGTAHADCDPISGICTGDLGGFGPAPGPPMGMMPPADFVPPCSWGWLSVCQPGALGRLAGRP
jgi:hypothetical protein